MSYSESMRAGKLAEISSRWYLPIAFYALPFVDALTGFLVLSGQFGEAASGSFSQIARGILLVPALLVIRFDAARLVIFAASYFLLIEAVVFLVHQRLDFFLIGTIYDFKIVYLIVAYFVLVSPEVARQDVLKYFINGALIYSSILFATTLAGIQTPTYESEESFGSKGVFASGNALSMYLGSAALLALHRFREDKNRGWLIISAALIAACMLVATKASMVFLAAFLILLILRLKSWPKLIILCLVAFGILYFEEEIQALVATVFDVIVFRYEKSDSLITFLASGRETYVEEAFEAYRYGGLALLRIVFGAGSLVSYQDAAGSGIEYDTLESDVFDVFFAYGIFGIVVYLSVIVCGLIKSISSAGLEFIFAWMGVCFYSLMAGHVLFNGMSGMSLPVMLAALAVLKPAQRE